MVNLFCQFIFCLNPELRLSATQALSHAYFLPLTPPLSPGSVASSDGSDAYADVGVVVTPSSTDDHVDGIGLSPSSDFATLPASPVECSHEVSLVSSEDSDDFILISDSEDISMILSDSEDPIFISSECSDMSC